MTYQGARRLFWKLKVGLAIRQARRILTVSDHAARDVERVHGIPRSRITVATEAPSSTFYPVTDAESGEVAAALAPLLGDLPSGRRFTYVGGFNPHKNVPVLIRAHAALARELGDAAPVLLLVGAHDYDDFFSHVPAIAAAIDREAHVATRKTVWQPSPSVLHEMDVYAGMASAM